MIGKKARYALVNPRLGGLFGKYLAVNPLDPTILTPFIDRAVATDHDNGKALLRQAGGWQFVNALTIRNHGRSSSVLFYI